MPPAKKKVGSHSVPNVGCAGSDKAELIGFEWIGLERVRLGWMKQKWIGLELQQVAKELPRVVKDCRGLPMDARECKFANLNMV